MKAEKAEKASSRFREAVVGIAGLGGLGSNVAMALARAGIGRLILVDFDNVEESNLNRQAYSVDQVGTRKTEALARNIAAANPRVDLTVLDMKLEPGKMELPFSSADIIVEALDDAGTKAAFIEEICLKLPGKPLIAASGVAGISGAERICLKRSGNLYMVQDELAPSCYDEMVLAPKVGIFACWQASLVLEILAGCRDGD